MGFSIKKRLISYMLDRYEPSDLTIGDVPTWDGEDFVPGPASGIVVPNRLDLTYQQLIAQADQTVPNQTNPDTQIAWQDNGDHGDVSWFSLSGNGKTITLEDGALYLIRGLLAWGAAFGTGAMFLTIQPTGSPFATPPTQTMTAEEHSLSVLNTGGVPIMALLSGGTSFFVAAAQTSGDVMPVDTGSELHVIRLLG